MSALLYASSGDCSESSLLSCENLQKISFDTSGESLVERDVKKGTRRDGRSFHVHTALKERLVGR